MDEQRPQERALLGVEDIEDAVPDEVNSSGPRPEWPGSVGEVV